MTGSSTHPGDELQLLIDGRLASERRAAVEAHVAECGRCRRELDALRRVRTALRQDLPEHPLPAVLAARVSAALATEAARARFPRRPLVIGLGLAAAAALVLLLLRPGQSDFVNAAARDFAMYRAATLRLDLETTQPTVLERYFASPQVPFPTRVFDFGMTGYRLAGGRVHRLAGRPSALFAYRKTDGARVLCQMYQGEVAELPAPAEEREHHGIRFLIYHTEDLTLVFWQEGLVMCVLVAEGDAEAAILLAYAKAIKV